MSNKQVYITLIIIWVLLVIMGFGITKTVMGQTTQNFFQEVVMPYGDIDYCFRRESVDCKHWSEWINKPAWDNRKDAQTYKPRRVDQKVVCKMLGSALSWLNSRPRISGYYNFSTNYNYDWPKFGGEHYGTYVKERVTFRVYQPRKK